MLMNPGRLLRQIVLQYSNKPALINVERGRKFTYNQLDDLSNRITNLLKYKYKLSKNDFYATILENDNMGLFHPWMLKSDIGAAWIDIRETDTDQISRIDFTSSRVVFLENRLLPKLYDKLVRKNISIIAMDQVGSEYPDAHYFWDLVENAPTQSVEIDLPSDDAYKHTCFIRFTSGTSGKAKCAMYSLNNILVWSWNPAHYTEIIPYDNPKIMLFSPVHHAASCSTILPIIIKGGTIVTLNKADLDNIGDAISREQINMIYAVPTILYRMLDYKLHSKYNLKSLKTMRYGAAPISPAKLEQLLDIYGKILIQTYGSTESWPSCTILGREDHAINNELALRRLSSIGRPFPGQEVLVCDDAGNEVPNGEYGELWIRGINTICGYFKSPEVTMDNFSDSGYWKSGDIGYIDEDGYIYLVDRKKDLIISGGYNVYATEVENCLNSHPGIQNSAVVGIPDEDWGEAVCAVIIQAENQKLSDREIYKFCKENLAGYKTPKKIVFIDKLPLNSAGKILRRKVKEMLLDRQE